VAEGNRRQYAAFIAIKHSLWINREAISQFVERQLSPDQWVHGDALSLLVEIDKTQNHTVRVTPSDKEVEWYTRNTCCNW